MIRILFFSLLATVAFSLSDKCVKESEKCTLEGKEPIYRPGTEEEFDALCKFEIQHDECLLAVKSNCDSTEDKEDLRYINSTLTMFKHICNKENDIYENLVANLPCFNSRLEAEENTLCMDMLANKLYRKKFEKILINAGITDVDTDNDCFDEIFRDMCWNGEVGAICGATARGVSVEIFEIASTEEDSCMNKLKGKTADLSKDMEVLYLESKEELAL